MAQIMGTRSHDFFELKGTAGNIVFGFAGDDTFEDSIGADWMRGGAGNDNLFSTSGSDLMFGGAGDDEFHLLTADANIMIRGGSGFDDLILDANLLAPGEEAYLQYVSSGILLQLADGHILDIADIEHVTLV